MSDTVKLIIEIPTIDRDILNNDCCGQTRKEAILCAVKHGIPLDEVKAEIKRMEYHMIDCDVLVSQDEVLEILDSVGEGDK